MLVIEGTAALGPRSAALRQAVFLKTVRAVITAGPEALVGLLAYLANKPLNNLSREDQERLPLHQHSPTDAVGRASGRARAPVAAIRDRETRA